MLNLDGICQVAAKIFIAPYETSLVKPATDGTATFEEIQDFYDAVNTAVVNSTNPNSVQNRVRLMAKSSTLTDESGDKKSIDDMCEGELITTYTRTVKLELESRNCKDVNFLKVAKGMKFVNDGTDLTTWNAISVVGCITAPKLMVLIETCPQDGSLPVRRLLLPSTLEGTISTKYADFCKEDYTPSTLTFNLGTNACIVDLGVVFDPANNLDITSA